MRMRLPSPNPPHVAVRIQSRPAFVSASAHQSLRPETGIVPPHTSTRQFSYSMRCHRVSPCSTLLPLNECGMPCTHSTLLRRAPPDVKFFPLDDQFEVHPSRCDGVRTAGLGWLGVPKYQHYVVRVIWAVERGEGGEMCIREGRCWSGRDCQLRDATASRASRRRRTSSHLTRCCPRTSPEEPERSQRTDNSSVLQGCNCRAPVTLNTPPRSHEGMRTKAKAEKDAAVRLVSGADEQHDFRLLSLL